MSLSIRINHSLLFFDSLTLILFLTSFWIFCQLTNHKNCHLGDYIVCQHMRLSFYWSVSLECTGNMHIDSDLELFSLLSLYLFLLSYLMNDSSLLVSISASPCHSVMHKQCEHGWVTSNYLDYICFVFCDIS